MKNSQNKNIQEEIKKVERKRLICKIGTNYYYGSVNLTYPIWEIIQETKEQRDKEMHKECEKSINEAIIRQRNLDMKMFKEVIEKLKFNTIHSGDEGTNCFIEVVRVDELLKEVCGDNLKC